MVFGELGAFCLFVGLVCLFGAYRLLRSHVEYTRPTPGFDPVRRSLLLVAIALGLVSLGLGFFAGNQARLAWRVHDLKVALEAQPPPAPTPTSATDPTLNTASATTDTKPVEVASAAVAAAGSAAAEPVEVDADTKDTPDGAQYVVAVSEGSALLRASPDGKKIGSAANGRRVVAVDPRPRAWNGRDWLHVRVPGQANGEGWIAYENLRPAQGADDLRRLPTPAR